MFRQQKSQVTVFIILGIIILLSGFLAIYLQHQNSGEDAVEPDFAAQNLEVYMKSCLEESSKPLIRNISINGGVLNFSGHETIQYHNVSYLYHLRHDDTTYQNQLITRGTMEEELDTFIARRVRDCLNFSHFREAGYTVEKRGNLQVDTTIHDHNVFVKLIYPLALYRGEKETIFDSLSETYFSDLGFLHDLGVKIMRDEVRYGFFDADYWQMNHSHTIVRKYKPYPDLLYHIRRYSERQDEWLTYKFAVDGFDYAAIRGQLSQRPTNEITGYCVTEDGNCHVNPYSQSVCESNTVDGDFRHERPDDCTSPSRILEPTNRSCIGGTCEDCGSHAHGESWCAYDALVGHGMDYPGSRHIKKFCFDGTVYVEECRDYREEICVEEPDESKAICRDNRWEDCAFQESEEACENMSVRDCEWTEHLYDDSTHSEGIKYKENSCHPIVPPGLRHWRAHQGMGSAASKQGGAAVCEMASEVRRFDGFEGPTSWIDTTSQNCMYQGDCGVGRTVADTLSMKGYFNTNRIHDGIPTEGRGYPGPGMTGGDNQLLSLTPLYLLDQEDLSSHTFSNEGEHYQGLLDEYIEFGNEVASWDIPCDFCDCTAGVPTGDCEYDKRTPFGSMCGVWKAPNTSDDCSYCEANENISCSRYRCKSLGNCIYTQEEGFGHCRAPAPDNTAPSIRFEGTRNDSHAYKEFIDPFLSVKGVKVCAGGGCDGSREEDGLQPYSTLAYNLNYSEEVLCRWSLSPAFGYGELPAFNTLNPYRFASNTTIESTVVPPYQMKQMLQSVTRLNTLLTLMDVDKIDDKVQKMHDTMISALDNLDDAPTVDLDDQKEQLNAMYHNYTNNISPMLHDMYDEYQHNLNALVTSMESWESQRFFKCVDRAGNTMEDDFFVNHLIADDTTPPTLLNVSPLNDTAVTTPFDLALHFDEPVECRWDIADLPYTDLSYRFDCMRTFFATSDDRYGCFYRNLTMDPSQIHVACKDQPFMDDVYRLKLRSGSSFGEYRDYFWVSTNTSGIPTARVDIPDMLRNNFSTILNYSTATAATMSLELNFSRKRECSLQVSDSLLDKSVDSVHMDQVPVGMDCEDTLCEENFELPDEGDAPHYIYAVCENKRTHPRNNISFTLGYSST